VSRADSSERRYDPTEVVMRRLLLVTSLILAGCAWTNPTKSTMERLDDMKACDDLSTEQARQVPPPPAMAREIPGLVRWLEETRAPLYAECMRARGYVKPSDPKVFVPPADIVDGRSGGSVVK
jgi:hypothetical protein